MANNGNSARVYALRTTLSQSRVPLNQFVASHEKESSSHNMTHTPAKSKQNDGERKIETRASLKLARKWSGVGTGQS